MDSVKLNKDGITPVKGLFGEISAIKSRKQVLPLMAEFYHEGISGLFYTSIDADAKDSKNNLVSIGQEGMTLSERSYYLDTDSESVALRDKYEKTIIDLFQLYGFSHAQAYANMKTIINIETEMAKVAYSRNVYSCYYSTYSLTFAIEIAWYLFCLRKKQLITLVIKEQHLFFPDLINLSIYYSTYSINIFII